MLRVQASTESLPLLSTFSLHPCVKTGLTSESKLDHQLHAQGRQKQGQHDDPEGGEGLPAPDQRRGG